MMDHRITPKGITLLFFMLIILSLSMVYAQPTVPPCQTADGEADLALKIDPIREETVVGGGAEYVVYASLIGNSNSIGNLTFTIGAPGNVCTIIHQDGDTNGNSLLDPGEIWAITCQITPTSGVGTLAVVVQASGQHGTSGSSGSFLPSTCQAQADLVFVKPSVSFSKTADQQVIKSGENVIYTITVNNTGDRDFQQGDVTISDTVCSTVSLTIDASSSDGVLNVGETWTYTCNTTLNVDTTNIATVNALYNLLNNKLQPQVTVTASDSAFVDVVDPRLQITKLVAEGTAQPTVSSISVYKDATVTYSVQVMNTGDVPLSNIVVSDAECPPVGSHTGTLAVGQTWTYTCSRTLSLPGIEVNEACANGDYVHSSRTIATSAVCTQATVKVLDPSCTVSMSPSTRTIPSKGAGQFNITVANSGVGDLHNISVNSIPWSAGCNLTIPLLNDVLPGMSVPLSCQIPNQPGNYQNFAVQIEAVGTDDNGNSVSCNDIATINILPEEPPPNWHDQMDCFQLKATLPDWFGKTYVVNVVNGPGQQQGFDSQGTVSAYGDISYLITAQEEFPEVPNWTFMGNGIKYPLHKILYVYVDGRLVQTNFVRASDGVCFVRSDHDPSQISKSGQPIRYGW